MRTASINIRTVNIADRFDGNYHLSEGVMIRKAISASPYPLINVGEAANRIFIGNRVKRVYVKSDEAGVPFMSSSAFFMRMLIRSSESPRNILSLWRR